MTVESASQPTGCRGSGTVAVAHSRRVVRLVDAHAWRPPVVLLWRKRRYRSREDSCEVATLIGQVPDLVQPRGWRGPTPRRGPSPRSAPGMHRCRAWPVSSGCGGARSGRRSSQSSPPRPATRPARRPDHPGRGRARATPRVHQGTAGDTPSRRAGHPVRGRGEKAASGHPLATGAARASRCTGFRSSCGPARRTHQPAALDRAGVRRPRRARGGRPGRAVRNRSCAPRASRSTRQRAARLPSALRPRCLLPIPEIARLGLSPAHIAGHVPGLLRHRRHRNDQ